VLKREFFFKFQNETFEKSGIAKNGMDAIVATIELQ
jgi:hypothetical protein